ncbi:MAG: hypothetical protein NWE89_11920, partial [Candidatus Bathyarchaeota archaeon]|nr:hypothetical protein [Candidatus Bathyarchaeota archaeon]
MKLREKTTATLLIAIFLMTMLSVVPVMAVGPAGKGKGFNDHGYNYRAKLFNGPFDGADRVWDGMYGGSDT